VRWSWQIARVAGIPIRIHATFLLLIGFIFFSILREGQGVAFAVANALLVLAVFVCIVLHEFGHALTARAYGIRTRDITLLPIGGVARLERMPERPLHEFLVAVAGPAVTLAIAGLLLAALAVFWPATANVLWAGSAPARITLFENPELNNPGGFLTALFLTNVVILFFNLIPAFPMDGGRVLRAILATRLDYVRATQIAAAVGQIIAVLFAVIGINSHSLVLPLVALFVFLAAGQESSMAQMRTAFAGVPVSRAMIRDFKTLRADEPLTRAVELLLAGDQQDFPVLGSSAGEPVGILTRRDLMAALAQGPRDRAVGDVARKDVGSAHPREYLEDVFQRIDRSGCPALLVVDEGRVVGMVTLENVGELAMVHAALGRSARRR
jgi:Zn-dependent protease/CBS domain-containing protein